MLTRYFYCTLVLICLFLTACQPPTVDPAAVVAAVNQTLTVQAFGQVQTAFAQTQTAFGKNPVSQPTQAPATVTPGTVKTSTNTPAPAMPLTPTKTPPPTLTPIPTSSTPKITNINVSPKGSTLYVEGKVEGVDPTKHVIAIYIRVTGGWWTKPTFANPITDIASNGAWSCNCQSYFTDADADTVRAYLIPKGYNPPSAAGGTMPPISYAVAMAEATR